LALVLVAAGGASAASPRKGGFYSGRTSQGERVTVEVDTKHRIKFLEADMRYPCSRIGPVKSFQLTSYIRVKRDGSFAHTELGSDRLDDPVVIDGRPRVLFEVAKNQVSGRFVTRRKVTGVWRARNALYDFELFPDSSDPVDKCDTGVVSWTARLQ
jgi:hypothetical protein